MREIAFKFYDKKTGKLLDECGMWCNYIAFLDQEDVFVCQYTGLHDKNGKEIYEGDIVRCLTELVDVPFVDEIIYDQSCCAFSSKHYGTHIMSIVSDDIRYIEVIGNIYENKELLDL